MDLETIEALFEEHEINRVKLGGFDIDGVLRGKYVRAEKFASAVKKGLGFCDVIFGWDIADVLYDNARVTGWHTGYPDLTATVDLNTVRQIPWEPGTAAFLLDLDPRVCPRLALKRVVERAVERGLRPMVGCEFEFFLFAETPEALREKGWRDLRPLTPGMFGYSWLRSSQKSELVHDLLDGLEAFDCDIEGFHTETGPGVYEAALAVDDAVAAADKAALFKTAVKEICARHGVIASFMAKWSTAYPGCSGHAHQSLWDLEGERNLFHDAGAEHRMSSLMRHYLAGQLELMGELAPFYAPTINSYKRLVPGTWAPTSIGWGLENRTCALRAIPGLAPEQTRVEFRLTGADANPYLSLAASLASGLWGIENETELRPMVEGNAYEDEAYPLPRSLEESLAGLRASKVAGELLGEDLVDHFARTRDWEVRQYQQAVGAWELDRYFELV